MEGRGGKSKDPVKMASNSAAVNQKTKTMMGNEGGEGCGAGSGGGGGGKNGGSESSSKKKKKKAAAAVSSIRCCANCGAPEGSLPGILHHKPCGKCLITFYCGSECQRTHWKAGHKKHCKTPEERSVAKAQAETASSSGAAAEERDPDNECAICFDDLSDSPSPALPCSHRFHTSCVDELRKACLLYTSDAADE